MEPVRVAEALPLYRFCRFAALPLCTTVAVGRWTYVQFFGLGFGLG